MIEEELELEAVRQSAARQILDPTVGVANTVPRFLGTSEENGDPEVQDYIDALKEQCSQVHGGDMKLAESMLVSQANLLNVIFVNLATKSIGSAGSNVKTMERQLRLGLRAQSQCRATLETLSAIKNPPIARYVGQANVAQGHQQVNNDSHAGEKQFAQNELLEAHHGERLDFGAAEAPIGADKELATVEPLYGTQDGGG